MITFDLWSDWVNDSAHTPTYNEKQNATLYSGYVMKWYCDVSSSSTPIGSACCIRHATLGALCLVNKSLTDADTYTFTAVQAGLWIDGVDAAGSADTSV